MAVAPWIVSDELWELVEPLLPVKERRFRYPGRRRLPDREALQGILFVLHTGSRARTCRPSLASARGCPRTSSKWGEIHPAATRGPTDQTASCGFPVTQVAAPFPSNTPGRRRSRACR